MSKHQFWKWNLHSIYREWTKVTHENNTNNLFSCFLPTKEESFDGRDIAAWILSKSCETCWNDVIDIVTQVADMGQFLSLATCLVTMRISSPCEDCLLPPQAALTFSSNTYFFQEPAVWCLNNAYPAGCRKPQLDGGGVLHTIPLHHLLFSSSSCSP